MRLASHRRRSLAPTTIGIGVCLVVLGGLTGLVAARAAPVVRTDDRVAVRAHAAVLAHPWLLHAARAVTQLGNPTVIDVLAGALALAVLWSGHRSGHPSGHRSRDRRSGWIAAAAVALSRLTELALERLIKHLVGRPRPELAHPVAHATGFGFPSGHAAGSAVGYGLLVCVVGAYLRRGAAAAARKLTAACAAVSGLVVAAVAASRVLLGVHYLSDVVGGVALGLLCALAGARWIRPVRAD